ncbi:MULTISPECIES: hypothetical protein [unclassified Xanthobacter]|uniref:hypothetical protein n=1 Tax=unclassified Xanthobacter TaxID=2623496 RepID=UPI001F3E0AC5|nr:MULTISPECIES: hypothetical protein [unclassified Xanthobacter]
MSNMVISFQAGRGAVYGLPGFFGISGAVGKQFDINISTADVWTSSSSFAGG